MSFDFSQQFETSITFSVFHTKCPQHFPAKFCALLSFMRMTLLLGLFNFSTIPRHALITLELVTGILKLFSCKRTGMAVTKAKEKSAQKHW